MSSNDRVTQQMPCPSLICRICGDVARGMNFNVITCISCKAFFRRNALRSPNTLQCERNSNCKITIETRKQCRACRLKKCFAFGMNPKLVHSFHQHPTVCDQVQQILLPMPRPLGLLQNDRSTLTSEQWNLFSNIINIYNEENIVHNIKCLFAEESSLPAKLRVKPSFALNYISKCVSGIQTLVKRSSHFHSLEINSRRTLIQHNISLTGCLNGAFVGHEVDLWSNMDFGIAYNTLLGSDYFTQFSVVPKRMDPNGTLMKIMLVIIAFSSNYSIVIFNNTQNIKIKSNPINLIHIQDIIVTLLWKYLIYLYGHTEAILRYSSLIKTVLDILYELEELSNTEIFHQILSMIITQTEQLLIIDN